MLVLPHRNFYALFGLKTSNIYILVGEKLVNLTILLTSIKIQFPNDFVQLIFFLQKSAASVEMDLFTRQIVTANGITMSHLYNGTKNPKTMLFTQ